MGMTVYRSVCCVCCVVFIQLESQRGSYGITERCWLHRTWTGMFADNEFLQFPVFFLHLFSFNHNLHVLPLAFDQIFVEKLSWLHTLSLCFTYQSFLIKFCFGFTGEAVARACSVVTWLLTELH